VFEPVPTADDVAVKESRQSSKKSGVYTVDVEGKSYLVRVTDSGKISEIEESKPIASNIPDPETAAQQKSKPIEITAPLAGNVFTIQVNVGDQVTKGDTILVLEAMKMETDIRANKSGKVSIINVESGDSVKVGDVLLTLS
jgi:oxaloacetate decarboxylase alpha subunit